MASLAGIARALDTVFGRGAVEANEASGAVQRRRKFSPLTLTKTFILAFLSKADASSREIASMAASCGIEISAQAIDQRYSPALREFFEQLFPKIVSIAVDNEQTLAPLLERFTEVKIIDSSSIQLPDSEAQWFPSSGGAAHRGHAVVKFQTELDLRTGRILFVQPEPGKSNDQGTDRQHVIPPAGSLRIADLGYFSIPVLASISTEKAYFLTRVQHQLKIYVDGQQHSLVEWLNSQPNTVVDRMIELGATHRLNCRLIAWRVPEEIANRRRAKVRATSIDKYGKEPSMASLAACDWEFLVTNLPEEMLSLKEAIVLYRARWQIELLFKRWKSICRVGLMDGKDDVTKMCRFWIRMCGAIVQNWLIAGVGWSSTLIVSFTKLAKAIAVIVHELASALGNPARVQEVLEKLQRQAKSSCRQNKRKKHPGTIDLLRDPELLDYSLT